MYRLSSDRFLELISEGLKTPIAPEEIFSKEIKVSYLKRIDKVFNKGLHYYLDPKAPETSKEASVFFRKQHFHTDELNIGAVKVVNQFEELKLSLSAIAKLSDLDLKRKISTYTIQNDPKQVAHLVRSELYPKFERKKRDFLKSLIASLATKNILVFEFIETWNKKEKANIDGFYLKPNVIVLKRHQSFSREIFTLAHELGHYLLDEEEIEEIDYNVLSNKSINKIERWCNDFAFFFLAGEYANVLSSIEVASPGNDYHHDLVDQIAEETHLSPIAIFTRMLFDKKISKSNYSLVKSDFDEQYRIRQEEKEREKALLEEQGIKQRGSVAKPINSPLFVSTIQTAFYEGVLNEYEVCKKLNIKPENLDKYIQ